MKRTYVGKGKTVHLSEFGEETLCGKFAGAPADDDAEVTCKMCLARAEREKDSMNDDVMDEITADVQAIVDQLAKLNSGDADRIQSLQEQGLAELNRIKSAPKRVPLTMKIKTAAAEALSREASKAVAVREETTDVTQIEGYHEIVDNAANRVASAIKSETTAQGMAYSVAEAILDGRLRIYDKNGHPDLRGTRQASRNLATNIYHKAAEKLRDEGWMTDKADFQTLLTSLQQKVSYQMSAVLPRFIKSLDHSPEEFAALWPDLEEQRSALPEDERPARSDMIFDAYKISRLSKAEMMARRRAELKARQSEEEAPALEAPAGVPEIIEEHSKEDEQTAEKRSPVERLTDSVSRMSDRLSRLDVANLTEEESERLRITLLEFVTLSEDVAMKLRTRGRK